MEDLNPTIQYVNSLNDEDFDVLLKQCLKRKLTLPSGALRTNHYNAIFRSIYCGDIFGKVNAERDLRSLNKSDKVEDLISAIYLERFIERILLTDDND